MSVFRNPDHGNPPDWELAVLTIGFGSALATIGVFLGYAAWWLWFR